MIAAFFADADRSAADRRDAAAVPSLPPLRGGMARCLASARGAGFLSAAVVFVDSGPGPSFRFLLQNASLFVTLRECDRLCAPACLRASGFSPRDMTVSSENTKETNEMAHGSASPDAPLFKRDPASVKDRNRSGHLLAREPQQSGLAASYEACRRNPGGRGSHCGDSPPSRARVLRDELRGPAIASVLIEWPRQSCRKRTDVNVLDPVTISQQVEFL